MNSIENQQLYQILVKVDKLTPVSYTHLDVYKRQAQGYPTDNLEDTFLALIDADNRQRGAAK